MNQLTAKDIFEDALCGDLRRIEDLQYEGLLFDIQGDNGKTILLYLIGEKTTPKNLGDLIFNRLHGPTLKEITKVLHIKCRWGKTPLDYAKNSGNEDVVSLFTEPAMDFNASIQSLRVMMVGEEHGMSYEEARARLIHYDYYEVEI